MFKAWWKTCARSGTKYTLLVEHEVRVIEFLMGAIESRPPILKKDKGAQIWDIYVNDDFRGMGMGAALMEKFFEWARLKGVDMVTLQVSPPNKRGINFYKKHGFNTILQLERKMI